MDRLVGPDGLLTPAWVAYFQKLTGVDGYVFEVPSCRLYSSAAVTIAHNTQTDVAWANEDHDNVGMHSTTTNTDRITIPEAGAYCFGAHLIWTSNAVGDRALRISLNDASPISSANTLLNTLEPANAATTTKLSIAGVQELAAGDILRVSAFQDSTGNLDILGQSSGYQSNGFWCFKVANAVR